MTRRRTLVRALTAVAVAAACALVLDAAVVLAADRAPATRPASTRPAVTAAASTQPVLNGRTIVGNDAHAGPADLQRPGLASTPNGGSSVDRPATITVGGGVDVGTDAPTAPPPVAGHVTIGGVRTTSRPADVPNR